MRTITAILSCLCVAALTLSGCGKSSVSQQSAAGEASAPASSMPTPELVAPPPSHNYAMVDNGTYGYEPGLSEDDVRNGRATKPLLMMRYVGNKNGTFVILILGTDANNPSVVSRVSCQAPCEFAKSETLSGDLVLRTETIRITQDSLVGAMLQDAISGQLFPYGQSGTGRQITMSSQQHVDPQVVAVPLATSGSTASGTADMWLGPLDMNLRSCPGTTCSALVVIPKNAKVSVDMASIRNVTEASGAQTPWAHVIYSGPYCELTTMDQKLGCITLHEPGEPITGWINYQRLSPTSNGR